MKTHSTTPRLSTATSYLVGALLVLVPFHAFLTVWAASMFGHYTAVRLWSALLLLILVGLAAWLLWRSHAWHTVVRDWLWRLIIMYAALAFLLGSLEYMIGVVSAKALAYGLLSDLRYLAFFLVVTVAARYHDWLRTHWMKLVLWPAAIVAAFAVLQYFVLPADFLRHFGYGPQTIAPYETINNNQTYLRVISTLRGANPLGAYAVLILGLVAALWVSGYRRARGILLGIVVAGALLFSFSRSAWLGAALALISVTAVSLKTRRSRRLALLIALGIVILTGLSFTVFHSDPALQNAIFHTQDKSTVAVSSNDKRESALKTGAREVLHEPLGRGPGTAGPASVYNRNHQARLSENYYLQIGQELGWIGMGLFIAIQAVVFRRLWQLRLDVLALGLLATGIGLVDRAQPDCFPG